MANILDIEANQLEKLKEVKAVNKKLRWKDFSFDKSQELPKDVKGNLSDLVIEERNER